MKGKERCKILKEIRREIAEKNDIEFVTSECKHKGDCLGTCPKCEEELRYLERELEKRQRLGKAVAVAGLTVSLTLSSAGCVDMGTTAGDMLPDTGIEQIELEGDLVAWEVPQISSITEENVMAELGSYTRANIRDAWAAYRNTQFEAEEGQKNSCDFYLTEDRTLIELMFDENDALVGSEFRYECYDE